MRFIPWPSRLAILVASRVYRAIGLVLRARDGDALAGRAVAPPWLKLACSGAALLRFGLTLLPAPAPRHDPRCTATSPTSPAPTTASDGPAGPASPAFPA